MSVSRRDWPRCTRESSHRDELDVDDLDLASFVCVTSIEALTHNAVLHYPKVFADEAMEALVDEGARLVTGFLKGGR